MDITFLLSFIKRSIGIQGLRIQLLDSYLILIDDDVSFKVDGLFSFIIRFTNFYHPCITQIKILFVLLVIK